MQSKKQSIKLVALSQQPEWPDAENENVLFMGEWCFTEKSPYKLSEIANYEVLQSPYQNGEMTEHLAKLSSLATEIIKTTHDKLNAACQQSHSELFWQTRLSPWALHWLIMINEVYCKVKSLPKNHTYLTRIYESPASVDSHIDYSFLTMNYTYWDILVSDILNIMSGENITCITRPAPQKPFNRQKTIRHILRNYFRQLYKFFFTGLKFRIGIIEGLNVFDRFVLYFSIDPLFIFRKRFSVRKHKYKKTLYEIGKKNCDISLNELALTLFFRYLPEHFLAQYEDNANLIAHVGNDIYSTGYESWTIAKLVADKKKWISYQHGACYGQIKCFSLSFIEYSKNFLFFTWGWTKPHTQADFKPIPLPSPVLAKIQSLKQSNNGKLLYISSSRPLFPYRLHTDISHYDMPQYIDNKFVFINHLSEQNRNSLNYRPYYNDYSTGEVNLLQDKNVKLLRGALDLDNFMAECELVIFDHLGTALHKALAMNKSTIAFWSPKHIQIDPNAEEYFSELKKVGVLHENAIDAANFINFLMIENKLHTWWSSPNTQAAIANFNSNFCIVDKNWRKTWINTLRDILKTNIKISN